MSEIDPATLANEYLDLARRIDEATDRQALIKENLKNTLGIGIGQEFPKWTYGDAVVQWVKGRKNTKLDGAKLRKVLILAGVELEIIEGAFNSATTESTGDPTLRISRAE